jgi:hypothetical protein
MKDRHEMQREYTRALSREASREPSAAKPHEMDANVIERDRDSLVNQRLRSKGQSPLKGIKTYQEDRAEQVTGINRALSPARPQHLITPPLLSSSDHLQCPQSPRHSLERHSLERQELRVEDQADIQASRQQSDRYRERDRGPLSTREKYREYRLSSRDRASQPFRQVTES